jgi:hypothetical protein
MQKLRAAVERTLHTAVHEASHATVARVLTLACGGTTIVPDAESLGFCAIADPLDIEAAWWMRGKVRGPDAAWHGHIIALMAGAEGEAMVFGSLRCSDSYDRDRIERYAEQFVGGRSWSQVEPRLRAMTRMLVRRHRPLIEEVAAALLDRKTLSGEELDGLVGRSVDDVRATGG